MDDTVTGTGTGAADTGAFVPDWNTFFIEETTRFQPNPSTYECDDDDLGDVGAPLASSCGRRLGR